VCCVRVLTWPACGAAACVLCAGADLASVQGSCARAVFACKSGQRVGQLRECRVHLPFVQQQRQLCDGCVHQQEGV